MLSNLTQYNPSLFDVTHTLMCYGYNNIMILISLYGY